MDHGKDMNIRALDLANDPEIVDEVLADAVLAQFRDQTLRIPLKSATDSGVKAAT